MSQNPAAKFKSTWKSPNIWATSRVFEGNQVRQLLVLESVFDGVDGEDGAMVGASRLDDGATASPSSPAGD